MSGYNDVIMEKLRPIYGQNNVSDLLGMFYTDKFGTRNPSPPQLATLYAAGNVNDAFLAYWNGISTVDIASYNFANQPTADSIPSFTDWKDTVGGTAWGRVTNVNGAGLAVSTVTPGTDSRAQVVRTFPAWAADGVSLKVTAPYNSGGTFTPVAAVVNDGIVGYGFTQEPSLSNLFIVTTLGSTLAAAVTQEIVPGDYDVPANGTVSEFELRIKSGQICGFRDGVRRCGPLAIDAAHVNSLLHGAHVHATSLGTGIIRTLSLSPFVGALPTVNYPAVVGTATTVTGNPVSAVNVPYPTGITAGEVLVVVIGASSNGTLDVPAGWSGPFGAANNTVNQRIAVFTKIATGSESGTQTFTKTGGTTGVMCGTMFRTTGGLANLFQSAGQANATSTTSLTAPSLTIAGNKKLLIWAGCVTGGTDSITVPAGYTQVAVTDPGLTLSVNVVVGYKQVDVVPQGATGTAVGTIGVAKSSVGSHCVMHPAAQS